MDDVYNDPVGVLELGCGHDPDERADTKVDVREAPHVDVIWDLNETPWPFPDASAEGVVMHHAMEHLTDGPATMHEVARVLEIGGWAELRVPFGADWFRDPTHHQFWTYRTPEYYGSDDDHQWNYYFDLPLQLTERTFSEAWLMAPWVDKLSPLFRRLARRYPGNWVCFTPWASGELTVRYQKIGAFEGPGQGDGV